LFLNTIIVHNIDQSSKYAVGTGRPTERGISRDGAPGPMSLGGPQAKRGEKTRVYLEQGKQNKMCAFVNM